MDADGTILREESGTRGKRNRTANIISRRGQVRGVVRKKWSGMKSELVVAESH